MADREPADSRAVIINAVSIVESYVDAALQSLIDASGIRDIPFADAMHAELQDAIYRSWDERFKWLARGFGVDLEGTTPQQEFLTLVDLRNALIHGQGKFTQRQTRDLAAVIELEHRLARVLDVEASKDGFLFGSRATPQTLSVARTLVLAIDDAVRRSHPRVGL